MLNDYQMFVSEIGRARAFSTIVVSTSCLRNYESDISEMKIHDMKKNNRMPVSLWRKGREAQTWQVYELKIKLNIFLGSNTE